MNQDNEDFGECHGPQVCVHPSCDKPSVMDNVRSGASKQISGLCRDHLKHANKAVNKKSEGIPEPGGLGLSANKDEVHYSGMGITPF